VTDPRVEALARKMCGKRDPDERVPRRGPETPGPFTPPVEDFGPRWWRFEEAARLAVVAHEFFAAR
jgi:hypothetical protein